jgi:site-specific DNA-methyltransferase (adenine-specific)
MKDMTQQSLFDHADLEVMKIQECADIIGVSHATIRNWIKSGQLISPSKGVVTKSSLDDFLSQLSASKKLQQRANKSKKIQHNHNDLKASILMRLRNNPSNLFDVSADYENGLSDSYKNKEGIYYTPMIIVHNLFMCFNKTITNQTFCDPCCGSGNFLIRALELGFRPENIYGFDIDPIAVEIAKQRIYEHTGYRSENIKCVDFLHVVTTDFQQTFDYIFTNPPWGKKLRKTEKQSLCKKLNINLQIDSSAIFYFACLKILNAEGILGLLLPDAFFNVAAYEDARISALSLNIQKLTHYGKPFKGLVSNAVGMILQNCPCDTNNIITCTQNNRSFERTVHSFIHNPKSIFNISCTGDEADLINYLYSIPHLTLQAYATWGLGIVTGDNSKFIENKYRQGLIPIHKGADITKNGIKPASNYIPEDLSLYQQVAPIALYKAPEKLIYKFISSNLCFYHDQDGRFILNSANMLIINEHFPISMKVMCDFLNCEFINWIYGKIFQSYKVLRSDLEALPIHTQFINGNVFSQQHYLHSLNIERCDDGTYRVKR